MDRVWACGRNLLTIQATAAGWTGGSTSLDVPWPLAADTALLRRALAPMRQVPAVTVYERVTGETALGRGTMQAIGISGRQSPLASPAPVGWCPWPAW